MPIPFQLERRRHPRTPLKMTVGGIRLDPDGGDVVESLEMFDISRGGMGAYVGRFVYPGQKIVLCLPTESPQGRRSLYATVMRCRECDRGFRVGLQFDVTSVPHAVGAASYTAIAA